MGLDRQANRQPGHSVLHTGGKRHCSVACTWLAPRMYHACTRLVPRNPLPSTWLALGLHLALEWLGGRMGVAWSGCEVALGWLLGAYRLATKWLWGARIGRSSEGPFVLHWLAQAEVGRLCWRFSRENRFLRFSGSPGLACPFHRYYGCPPQPQAAHSRC
jgi:hypothetical protein